MGPFHIQRKITLDRFLVLIAHHNLRLFADETAIVGWVTALNKVKALNTPHMITAFGNVWLCRGEYFSIKHDLARSCFQFWPKIGDEGDKISRRKTVSASASSVFISEDRQIWPLNLIPGNLCRAAMFYTVIYATSAILSMSQSHLTALSPFCISYLRISKLCWLD